jgi:hypothetical protein
MGFYTCKEDSFVADGKAKPIYNEMMLNTPFFELLFYSKDVKAISVNEIFDNLTNVFDDLFSISFYFSHK